MEEAHEKGMIVEYDRAVRAAEEKYGPIFAAFAEQPIEELAKNEDALDVGQRLFLQNCAQCHGSNAMGGQGFPNLTDDDWLYGGEPSNIKTTLREGRQGNMPAFGEQFSDKEINELANYVASLSGRERDADLVEAGKANFAVCSACHGADGKGNQQLGAPNLTDDVWLYGGSINKIEETLKHGRNGVMPKWKNILGEDKIHVISAYVYSLSNDE
jgi:cytochrome c oxidase cbb3-type subunit 3